MAPAVLEERVSTAANTPVTQAATLINELTSQARTILSSVLQNQTLVALDPASQGEFPYYYLNNTNLLFNNLTYSWINTNLKAGANPAQLDTGLFTNEYIGVLSKVVYLLSKADQATLVAAQRNANNQQMALLSAWQQAYNSIPAATPTMQPIDIILATIANTWATPATTLTAMQQSRNLNALLNNTPASGQPIRPVLASWLAAMGSSISLQNQTTMNNGYLQSALLAAQTATPGNPPLGNGGLSLDNNTTVPAYTVTPQPSDIVNSLSDLTANSITVEMTVTRSTQSEYKVSISGGASFSIPILSFFGVSAAGSASYFSDQIATSSNSVSIKMTFTGCNLVNFGPLAYNQSNGLGWAWFDPIRQAIQNGTQDVSGFKFSPQPQIDFSTAGPFGYPDGVAISNYPSVEITVKSANYQSILQTFQQQSRVGVSFLGIPLASATESTYSSSASQDASSSTVTIKLSPPQSLVAGNTNKSVGWLLGAVLSYPCA
jgi:hypothetical protein